MIEILGMALVLLLWILDTDNKIKSGLNRKTTGFFAGYIIGFALLAAYAVQIDMKFAIFFLLLCLVSVMELALLMARHR